MLQHQRVMFSRASTVQTLTPRRLTPVLALVVLVLLAQYASVIHAEEHLFHESDDTCIAFHQAEKQPLPNSSATPPASIVGTAQRSCAPLQRAIVPVVANFHARAPPSRPL